MDTIPEENLAHWLLSLLSLKLSSPFDPRSLHTGQCPCRILYEWLCISSNPYISLCLMLSWRLNTLQGCRVLGGLCLSLLIDFATNFPGIVGTIWWIFHSGIMKIFEFSYDCARFCRHWCWCLVLEVEYFSPLLNPPLSPSHCIQDIALVTYCMLGCVFLPTLTFSLCLTTTHSLQGCREPGWGFLLGVSFLIIWSIWK